MTPFANDLATIGIRTPSGPRIHHLGAEIRETGVRVNKSLIESMVALGDICEMPKVFVLNILDFLKQRPDIKGEEAFEFHAAHRQGCVMHISDNGYEFIRVD